MKKFAPPAASALWRRTVHFKGGFILQTILRFDWSVFQFIDQHLRCAPLDAVMVGITHLGDAGAVWIALLLILCCFRKTRRSGAAMGIALLCSLVLGDLLLKNLIARARPFDLQLWEGLYRYPGLIARPDSYSFPSGHTGSSVGAACSLLLCRRDKWGAAAVVLALLIGFSRIYLQVHYPTDVLAGAALGLLYGLIGFAAAKHLPGDFRGNPVR